MQGARSTRTSPGSSPSSSAARSASAPASSQASEFADPDGQRGRRRLALLHHVEMRIEGRDLVDFGHGEPHLLGQRAQMGRGQMAEPVLNEVQMLDQQIPAARRISQQLAHLGPGLLVQLAALGRAAPLALARFPDALALIQCHASSLSSTARTLSCRALHESPKTTSEQGKRLHIVAVRPDRCRNFPIGVSRKEQGLKAAKRIGHGRVRHHHAGHGRASRACPAALAPRHGQAYPRLDHVQLTHSLTFATIRPFPAPRGSGKLLRCDIFKFSS